MPPIDEPEEGQDLVVEVPETENPDAVESKDPPQPARKDESDNKPAALPREPGDRPDGTPALVQTKPPEGQADDEDDNSEFQGKFKKRLNRLSYKFRRADEENRELRQKLAAKEKDSADERARYESRVGQSDDLIIASREIAIEAEIKTAEQDYMKALGADDSTNFLAAQRRLNALAIQQNEVQQIKRSRDAKRASQVQPADPAPAALPTPDRARPAEANPDFAAVEAQARDLAEDFISNHDWWDKDPILTMAAHTFDAQLKQEGAKPWEAAFYEELDNRLRKRFPAEFGNGTSQSAPTSPRSSQPVAGVSRGGGVRQVRLTAEELALARRFDLTPEQYARQKKVAP